MALIVMPSLLSKRPWARIRARCEASFFIVLSKSARCCAVRGRTYLTIIDLDIGFTYRIVWMFYRGRYYTKKLLVEHLSDLRCYAISGLQKATSRVPTVHCACIIQCDTYPEVHRTGGLLHAYRNRTPRGRGGSPYD